MPTLPGAWSCRVSAGTCWSGVSILWLDEIGSLICNFYLSVAACKIEQNCPWDTLACCWDIKQPTNNKESNCAMYYAEVPTLPFWAEDLPLYVISPVLPFDRKISRWRKLKIFRSFYPFLNCPAIAFFIENSTERERKRAWVKRCCSIYF